MNSQARRTKVVYVTTPTQHFDTPNGQYDPVAAHQRHCVKNICIGTNPRAEIEKELLKPGVNVDALIDYEDVASGKCTSDEEIAHTTACPALLMLRRQG